MCRTSVTDPDLVHLEQNYPNPFNPVTTLTYQLPRRQGGDCGVQPYWRTVATLVDDVKDAGYYTVQWNGQNADVSVSSGIYFYTMRAGDLHTKNCC